MSYEVLKITTTSSSSMKHSHHNVVSMLPTSGDPALATMVPFIPPSISRGSGPSMSISTIPTMGSQLHPPRVMHGTYVPISIGTIVGPPQANLISSLPFMASINLPDLERLTNDPIRHQPH